MAPRKRVAKKVPRALPTVRKTIPAGSAAAYVKTGKVIMGWKKAYGYTVTGQCVTVLVKLEIPAHVPRVIGQPTVNPWRKCRAAMAIIRGAWVLEQSGPSYHSCDGYLRYQIAKQQPRLSSLYASHTSEFVYHVGDLVQPLRYPRGVPYAHAEFEITPWCSDPLVICTSGIHFFMEKRLAMYYDLG